MRWLLAGYMWLFIHRPFEVWPWLADLRIERVYMLITIAAWICSSNKTWISNRLNVAFAAFFGAAVLAWIASPYMEAGSKVIEDLFKVGVYYVLVISCIRDERDLRFLIAAFLVCTALYMSHSFREYLNGRHFYAMGTIRMIGVDTTYNDPNTFAASLLYALPMILPFWQEASTWTRRLPLLGYVGLTGICVFLTGSRTGLVGLFVLASIAVAMSKYRLRLALAALLLIPLVWSTLPQDRQDRYLTLLDPSRGPANAQESAESRQVFTAKAYELWKQQPIFGYGPGSFPLASGTGMQVHTLYGQLLGEVGLVGIAVFLLVIYGFVANARDVRLYCAGNRWDPRPFSFWLSRAVIMSVVLLLVLGFGGHNLFRYTWMWSGAFQVLALRVARDKCTSAGDVEPMQWAANNPSMQAVTIP